MQRNHFSGFFWFMTQSLPIRNICVKIFLKTLVCHNVLLNLLLTSNSKNQNYSSNFTTFCEYLSKTLIQYRNVQWLSNFCVFNLNDWFGDCCYRRRGRSPWMFYFPQGFCKCHCFCCFGN